MVQSLSVQSRGGFSYHSRLPPQPDRDSVRTRAASSAASPLLPRLFTVRSPPMWMFHRTGPGGGQAPGRWVKNKNAVQEAVLHDARSERS